MLWSYLIFVSALLICMGSGAGIVILGRRRKMLATDRGTHRVEGIAELASQVGFSAGLFFMAAVNFSVLLRLTAFPHSLAIPVACALILVLILGVQLGRLVLRYQLSRLQGELNTVTGEIAAKSR
jgi:hypothetical protein